MQIRLMAATHQAFGRRFHELGEKQARKFGLGTMVGTLKASGRAFRYRAMALGASIKRRRIL